MSDRLPCPKCRGATWLEQYDDDIVMRCLCGLYKYIQRKIDGCMVYTAAVKQADIVLPKRGTKIYKCFSAIGQRFPKVTMTAEVARVTRLQNKETAALLVALQARGLIRRHSERRGIEGGSEWVVTTAAERFFIRRN